MLLSENRPNHFFFHGWTRRWLVVWNIFYCSNNVATMVYGTCNFSYRGLETSKHSVNRSPTLHILGISMNFIIPTDSGFFRVETCWNMLKAPSSWWLSLLKSVVQSLGAPGSTWILQLRTRCWRKARPRGPWLRPHEDSRTVAVTVEDVWVEM